MSLLAAVFLESTVFLVVMSLVAGLLGRRSASVRHGFWAATLAGLVLLPVAEVTLPVFEIPVLPAEASRIASPGGSTRVSAVSSTTRASGPSASRAVSEAGAASPSIPGEIGHIRAPGWREWAFGLWLLGAFVVVARLSVGTASVLRIAHHARPAPAEPWKRLLRELGDSMSISPRVEVRIAHTPLPPMTWGLFRFVILLPEAANGWSEDRRRLVLAHELAHIRRRDPMIQLLAQALSALYWVQPLFWYAIGRLGVERECASDDQVLALEVGPSDYAEHLLEVTRGLSAGVSLTAVAMAGPSQLEGRVRAILDPGARRQAISRLGMASVLLAVTLAAASGAAVRLTPAQSRAPATSVVSGRVVAPDGRPLVNAGVLVVSAGDPSRRGEGRTDDRGEYRVWGLAPGAYYVAVVPRAGPDASEAAYATTYYPSAARLTEAEEVVVRGGDAMRADLLVQPATGVRVSGTVTVGVMATGGSLPAPFSIELLPHARSPIGVPSARSLPVASAIGGTERFEIANVPPGAYDLVARATSGGEWHFGRTAVEVGPAGVDGISVEVRPNQVLTGQVVLAPAVARTAVLMGAIRLGPEPANPAPGLGELMRLSVTAPDASGRFAVRGVPEGEYTLAVSGGAYVAGLARGEAPVEGIAIGPSGGEGYRVLLDRAGVVGIDLFDDTGDALPDVSVVLEQSEVFSRRSGNTDASGRISFPGVAPGVYTLAVRENTETVTVRPGVDLDFRYRISSGGDLVPLSPDRPLVEGSVWTSGEPAVGASVLLAPRETGAEAALFRVLATDVEGRFALRETLPDGSYRIMAFDSLPAGWADDPSFVSRYESLGRLVELSSDTHSRVELRLISEP